MMHFVRAVSIMRAYKATKTHCYEEVRNYGKILFMLLKIAGEGMHTQHTPHPPWLYHNKRWPQI